METKCHLKYYVLNCLSKDGPPNSNDHAYFPTLDDIRNHIHCESQVQKNLKLPLVDLLALKVAEYRKLSPDTKIHFQPFIKSDKGDNNRTESLWVHQEPWQQDILMLCL